MGRGNHVTTALLPENNGYQAKCSLSALAAEGLFFPDMIYHYIIWSYSTFDTRETTLIFITWQSKVSSRHRMNDLWNSQTWYHHWSDDLMLTHSFWSWFVGSSLITREPVDISWGTPAPPRHALHEVKGILTRVLTHTTGNKISSPQLAVRKALLTLGSRWAHYVQLQK